MAVDMANQAAAMTAVPGSMVAQSAHMSIAAVGRDFRVRPFRFEQKRDFGVHYVCALAVDEAQIMPILGTGSTEATTCDGVNGLGIVEPDGEDPMIAVGPCARTPNEIGVDLASVRIHKDGTLSLTDQRPIAGMTFRQGGHVDRGASYLHEGGLAAILTAV